MIGIGFEDRILENEEIYEVFYEAFREIKPDGKRILFVIPDHTRTVPIGLLFRIIYSLLADRARLLDFLIALGTHPPMSNERIMKMLEIERFEYDAKFSKSRFFNHYWNKPDQLKYIGTIKRDTILEVSNGLMDKEVDIHVNKIIFDYDMVIIVGPVFPHEVIGFSGGNKYFFPGVAGQEIIDMFHWLGALITSPVIIGEKYTPVRNVVDLAASFIRMEKYCFSLVVKGDELCGVYFGTPEVAWDKASDLSKKVHIVIKDRPFKKVLSRAPEMYDDLWVGAKCMYKLEPVVADGGELIIYAPHITEISYTHGKLIRQIGYHVRDFYLEQWDKYKDIPWAVLAHSTHVKGVGKYGNGLEVPRINVILATGISKEICHQINLGYINYNDIKIEDWVDKESEGILYVPKAGEYLYRLQNDPFKKGWS
ncbi:MAG: DUF2088 domain-containing protein [Candidatus Marinimicrobia bacterium]|nr:DUF2088 domain-containing protein [Candidatus Neomarinimicrobiota bacterium]